MIRASSCREKALFLEGIYLLVLIEIEQRSDLLLPGVYYLLIILINRAIGVLRDRMAEQGVVEARLEIIEVVRGRMVGLRVTHSMEEVG